MHVKLDLAARKILAGLAALQAAKGGSPQEEPWSSFVCSPSPDSFLDKIVWSTEELEAAYCLADLRQSSGVETTQGGLNHSSLHGP